MPDEFQAPFSRPVLDDIIPYMDDTNGVHFKNISKNDAPLEWVAQSLISSGSIESMNEEIIKLAKDAAVLLWLTNDRSHAELSYGV